MYVQNIRKKNNAVISEDILKDFCKHYKYVSKQVKD